MGFGGPPLRLPPNSRDRGPPAGGPPGAACLPCLGLQNAQSHLCQWQCNLVLQQHCLCQLSMHQRSLLGLKDSLVLFLTLVQSPCQSSGRSDALEGEVRMMMGQVGLSLLAPVRVVRFPSIHSPYWGFASAWLLHTRVATHCNPLRVDAVQWYKIGFAPLQLTLELDWDKLH